MLRLQFSIELAYEVTQPPCDFIFNVQAARTACQRLVEERLVIAPLITTQAHVDALGNRFLRMRAPAGEVRLHYAATVDIDPHVHAPQALQEVAIDALPAEVLPYLNPSRYCESDELCALAAREFGTLVPGYASVMAVQTWVQQRISFRSGTSNPGTSAADTLAMGAGVCRDFAHLMIALCRAINIPARFVTGFDYGADRTLGPPDFHAYVEVFLGRHWYIFDASGTSIPMGFVRLGTGRDAADVPFATLFGGVRSQAPVIQIAAVEDASRGFELPRHRAEALSTLPPCG